MGSSLKTGNSYLNNSVDYLLGSNGKMLRPALLLIGSRFGKSYKKKESELIDLATAIETLHIATLLHDDVIDESKTRRGQESIQSKYTKKYSIYMGDYLLSQCFLMLTNLQVPKELAIRLAKVVEKICIGEIKQDNNRFNFDISPMEYLRIISGKTASLFAIALSAGSYITGSSDRVIKLLGYIGYQLGIAFQIADDLLDYTGDERVVGKDLKHDLIKGVYGAPLIYAIKEYSEYKGEIIKLLKLGIDSKNVNEVINLIKSSGAIEQTRLMAIRYHERAEKLIHKLPDGSGKELLSDLIPKLISRIY